MDIYTTKKIPSFFIQFFICPSILLMLLSHIDVALAVVTPKEYFGAIFIENKEKGYFNYKIWPSESDNGYAIDVIRNFYPTKDTVDSGENNELHLSVGNDFNLNSLRLKIKRPKDEITVEAKAEEKTVSIDFIKNDYITHDKIPTD